MAPDEVLARVFGLLESLVTVSIGLGALIASLVVASFGPRTALIGIGLVCPVLALASWWRLRALTGRRRARRGGRLLQRVPMLRMLPLPSIEQLARGSEPVEVPSGRVVFSQGDVGDRYYVIESGEVEVVGDGRPGTVLGPGEGFGEIALLRRTPRTATVVARSDVRLRALLPHRFLHVVLGFPAASARGRPSGVDRLLGQVRPHATRSPPRRRNLGPRSETKMPFAG